MARMGTRARLAGFAVAALWSGMGSTAAAAVISDAPAHGGPGLAVNTQYQSQGVTFKNASAFDYSKGSAPMPGFPRSPNVAVEPCVGIEFCQAPVGVSFTSAQRNVKVWVGFSYPLNAPLGVRLTAYDSASAVVGTATATLPANPKPTPIRTPQAVSVAAGCPDAGLPGPTARRAASATG